MSRIITLTTDFGTVDGFVGAMKGVILSLCPDARIIDITHDIPPQDVLTAALTLETAAANFPPNTIHLAVVDPGVGSDRAPLYVETRKHVFIGPDNGMFDLAGAGRMSKIMRLRPSGLVASISKTFHGRDIFAPAAAQLANGMAIEMIAEPADNMVRLNLTQAEAKGADLKAHVLHADRFGNIITDLRRFEYDDWNREGRAIEVVVNGRRIEGLSETYADVPEGRTVAYFGSGGRLELGIRNNSLLAMLNWKLPVCRGQVVTLRVV